MVPYVATWMVFTRKVTYMKSHLTLKIKENKGLPRITKKQNLWQREV